MKKDIIARYGEELAEEIVQSKSAPEMENVLWKKHPETDRPEFRLFLCWDESTEEEITDDLVEMMFEGYDTDRKNDKKSKSDKKKDKKKRKKASTSSESSSSEDESMSSDDGSSDESSSSSKSKKKKSKKNKHKKKARKSKGKKDSKKATKNKKGKKKDGKDKKEKTEEEKQKEQEKQAEKDRKEQEKKQKEEERNRQKQLEKEKNEKRGKAKKAPLHVRACVHIHAWAQGVLCNGSVTVLVTFLKPINRSYSFKRYRTRDFYSLLMRLSMIWLLPWPMSPAGRRRLSICSWAIIYQFLHQPVNDKTFSFLPKSAPKPDS